MQSVLFVCLGNICRSPLAEGIAKKYSRQKGIDLVVESAGTGNWHVGEPPCEGSRKIALQNGIDISMHRARTITQEDIKKFDIIVALDSKNLRDLKSMGAQDALLLGDFGYGGEDVPDPYFFDGFEGFAKVYEMIETCVRNLIDEYCK